MLGYVLHHIGVACRDIEEAAEYMKCTHSVLDDSGTVYDPEQGAYVRLFKVDDDGAAIELVSGPAVASVVRRGQSYYHVCYAVPDIREAIAKAKRAGAVEVSPPKPAILFGGRRVAFVYTAIGLVEFLESS